MKKILSLFMFVMCIAVSANAQSGTTADGLSWKIENDVLTITGNGAINDVPWVNEYFSTVVLGEGVTAIGDGAFYNCWGLETIYYFGNEVLVNEDNYLAIFGSLDTQITLYRLPNCNGWSGDKIKNAYFYHNNGNILWTINSGTFTVKSDDVNSNGHLFDVASYYKRLSSVTKIDLDKGVTSVKVVNNVLLTKDGGSLLLAGRAETIEIPESVENIGDYAFYGVQVNYSLIAQPKTAPNLGVSVFYVNKGIVNAVLSLPNVLDTTPYAAWLSSYTFKSVDNGVFETKGQWDSSSVTWEYVNGVLYIKGEGAIPNGDTFVMQWKKLGVKNVEIQNGITQIGNFTFAGLDATSFDIAKNVTSIGASAFASNSKATYTFRCNVSLSKTGINNSGEKASLILTDKVELDKNEAEFAKVTLNRTFDANSGGTLILPFDAIAPNNLKVYELESFSNKVMKFNQVNTVKANTPYVWRNTSAKNISSISSLSKTTLNEDYNDEYAGAAVNDWALYGVFRTKTISAENPGVTSDLWIYVGSTGLFKNYDAVKVSPYRAYLKGLAYNEVFSGEANNINASFPERSLSIEFVDMDGTTSIEEVVVDREGNISSSADDGVYYDLSGRRVENPTTGIYIVNGKKVLVK